MDITLNTITTDLLNVVRGSNVSQSEPISKRQIEAWVHQYRSLLIKQDLDKGKVPNPDYIQEINQLLLTSVDLAGDDITGFGVTSDYSIYKSVLELPKSLDLNFKSGLTFVGTPTGREILFVPETRARWQRYKKYTDNDAICFLRGGYLYLRYGEPLSFLTVRGIFEIPSEVGRFVNPTTDQPYFDGDSKYPIPANMLPTLKEMILRKELGIEAMAFSDVKADASHGVSPQTEDVRYTQRGVNINE